MRSSAAATGSHTNASVRVIARTVRSADVPVPPGSVRRSETSSTTPSGPGRHSCVIPRSTDAGDIPRYAAIVVDFAWHPSGRIPSAFTFTYTDNATSVYAADDTRRIGTRTRCRRTGADSPTAAADTATALIGPPA
ncbi:hypothetical protein ACWDUB_22165 [Streptomyces fungicidicus]